MRLPKKMAKDARPRPVDSKAAWLAPLLGDKAEPAESFTGKADEAVWLPNERIAKAWSEYVKTGAVGDLTPPAKAKGVMIAGKGDKSVEITWDGDADLESGVRAFVIDR